MLDGVSASELIAHLRAGAAAGAPIGAAADVVGRGATIDADAWHWLSSALSTDPTRGSLTHVHTEGSTLAASDGHRAHYVDVSELDAPACAIPGTAVAFIARAMKAAKVRTFKLDVRNRMVTATVQGAFLSFVVTVPMEEAHASLIGFWSTLSATAPEYAYAGAADKVAAALIGTPCRAAPGTGGKHLVRTLEPRACDLAVVDVTGARESVGLPVVDLMAPAWWRLHVRADYLADALAGFGAARVTLSGAGDIDPLRFECADRRAVVATMCG
jgi:hypothetical protein